LGIGDCAQSPIPNPQSPIPNPLLTNNIFLNLIIKIKLIIFILKLILISFYFKLEFINI